MLDAAVRVLFLNILVDFKQKYGMTTLFITHDLSTAYYVGGDVMVMSRGRIVERGPVDEVMLRPAHPYTRLLLASLPSPDPDVRWTERLTLTEQTAERQGGQAAGRTRCLFAERCPEVMDRCWEQIPPAYDVAAGHWARCFLYDGTAGGGAAGAEGAVEAGGRGRPGRPGRRGRSRQAGRRRLHRRPRRGSVPSRTRRRTDRRGYERRGRAAMTAGQTEHAMGASGTRRRLIGAAPLLAVAPAALAACGGTAPAAAPEARPEGGPPAEVIWTSWATDDLGMSRVKEQADLYAQEFPRTKVTIANVPSAQYQDKLLAGLAGAARPPTSSGTTRRTPSP